MSLLSDSSSARGVRETGSLLSTVRRTTKAERAEAIRSYYEGQRPVNLPSRVQAIRHFVVSPPWITVQALAIATDIAVALIEWSCNTTYHKLTAYDSCQFARSTTCDILTVATSLMYCTDLTLRVIAFQPRIFFSKGWNIVDFIIVVGTSILSVVELSIGGWGLSAASFLWTIRVTRVLRSLRAVAMMGRTTTQSCTCMRRISGENKRRFVSPEHDFDLDLVYITPRLIGMSVPATGCWTPLYRNPISEVARFFERFHPDAYAIINMCPELPYSSYPFRTGSVHRYAVQDHAPPLLADTVLFLEFAREWMSHPQNVLAIHCRGGKGRTGSFCCAWLMYVKEAEDAEDARNYFALRRTDTDRHRIRKSQGVETVSQVRYLTYVEKLLQDQKAYFPKQVLMPRPALAKLLRFQADGVFTQGPLPQDSVVALHDVSTQKILYWSTAEMDGWPSSCVWNLGGVTASGDLRLSVFGREGLPASTDVLSRRMKEAEDAAATGKHRHAGREPGCLFFFTFHSSFLNGGQMVIPMSMVDMRHCRRKWYDQEALVTLSFEIESKQ